MTDRPGLRAPHISEVRRENERGRCVLSVIADTNILISGLNFRGPNCEACGPTRCDRRRVYSAPGR
jgi:hypothetical protein